MTAPARGKDTGTQTNDERTSDVSTQPVKVHNALPQRDRMAIRLKAGERTRISVCRNCDTLLYFLPRWGWYHDKGGAERCSTADVESFNYERERD